MPYLVQRRFANVDALFFVHNFGHCQKEEYEAVERIWHADQTEADSLLYVVDADASHEPRILHRETRQALAWTCEDTCPVLVASGGCRQDAVTHGTRVTALQSCRG